MSAVFRQSLELIQPHLCAPLFPSETQASLLEAADWLTADVRVGLECRLDERGGPVDLSQQIDVRKGGAERLGELARGRERCAAAAARPTWRRLGELARATATGPAPVDAIWLEYDLGERLGAGSVPSVFANLATSSPVAWPELHALLRLLGADDAHGALEATLGRAAEKAASFGGRLRGICGVMLARQNQSRIMILGVPPEAAVDYLLSIGWPGDEREVAGVLEVLCPFTRDVVLSLELAPTLQPRVGLELRLDGAHGEPEQRERLLELLVSRGVCTGPKRDALLAWAGQLTPANAPTGWPESLLVESLLRAPDEFGVFQRTLHHLKVAAGGGQVVAKAYLGFVHTWLKPTLPGYAHVI